MSEEDKLIMMVGLPRSGKTTMALELSRQRGIPIVNPDSIRLALHGERFLSEAEPMVWAMAKYMVAALFLAGHSQVIVDATNTTRRRRDEWVDKRWVREFFVVDTSEAVCMKRAESEGDTEIMQIIVKMGGQFEPIDDDEYEEWERV